MMGAMSETERPRARELNNEIRYVIYAVFKAVSTDALEQREAAGAEVQELLDAYEAKGVVTRGCYDVAGFRADADFLFWWVAPSSDQLQEVYSAFRRTRLGRACEPVWSAMALHRPAEFNKGHIPAFLAGIEPLKYVCVYPFVRSYEWYLLPDDERRAMLAEHGADGAASTPTCGPTPSPASPSATTSGCSRSRPTSCTASST